MLQAGLELDSSGLGLPNFRSLLQLSPAQDILQPTMATAPGPAATERIITAQQCEQEQAAQPVGSQGSCKANMPGGQGVLQHNGRGR